MVVYQARVGDGFREKGLKRTNSYFSTPKEAVTEALALKKKIDSLYKNEIKWDYSEEVTGPAEKMKILKGYLSGHEKSKAFYLQIISMKRQEEFSIVPPIKLKNISSDDEKMMTKVVKLFK
ncbi:hypothetical protein [Metabacillus fastidiosus]|uniref:WGR domain-containing protein n=1 Tax=Metabacillus fastidiosus TaxID=1458 RepID=A0ABU6NXB8_9BACI|nr:hypothetical protein [Metabacillus fastidiosus]MED4401765.1 hypothetical protein [Metabacillus fastidiosus]MED4452675.1 hypothetical protein [Metabacillus fastidiosus]MED4463403.1 hypothetical protein [Metabacillus fastidiosus]